MFNMKPITSCINLGYYQIKANQDICFKSKAKVTTDEHNIASGDVLELDDKKYIIEIGQPMLEGDKTTSELTKVFVLNVLCKQLEGESEGVFNLLVTSPPISFKRQSKELPGFLEGEYNVKYNKEEKKIAINKVVVLPETFIAYVVNNPSKLKNKKALIIDIGGKTTNICLLTDCKFNLDDDYVTLTKGMYHINGKIAKILDENEYTTYSDNEEDIELLRENNSDLLTTYKNEIDAVYSEHAEQILKAIQKKAWQIDNNNPILICGGGGILLEKYIKEIFPHATLSKDPLYDNLNALELMAKGMFK